MDATGTDAPAKGAADGETADSASPIQWFERACNWLLGFNPPGFRDPRISSPVLSKPTDDQIRYAEMIAKQIEVEQGLASTRMTWNLTFQGFTIAAYALVAASGGTAPAKGILGTSIGLASAVIAYMTMRGIVASQVQRKYLKDCWAANELTDFFPEPFSISTTSSHGRLPSYSICLVLIFMWAILLATQPWIRDNEPTKVQLVPPVILPAPAAQIRETPQPGAGGSRPAKPSSASTVVR